MLVSGLPGEMTPTGVCNMASCSAELPMEKNTPSFDEIAPRHSRDEIALQSVYIVPVSIQLSLRTEAALFLLPPGH